MLAGGPPCTAIRKRSRPLIRNLADSHPKTTPPPCCISHDQYLTLLQLRLVLACMIYVSHIAACTRACLSCQRRMSPVPLVTDPLEEIPDQSTVCNTVVRRLHIVIDRRDGVRGAHFAVPRSSPYA